MSFIRSMTVLQVADVDRSVGFYERLGFANHGTWQHDGIAQFAIVQRGDVTIALQHTAGAVPVNSDWAVYIYVSDLEALHAEFVRGGIEATDINRPDYYGCDDFDVVDPDRHRLAFGQAHDPLPGPGLSENRGLG